MHDRYIGLMSGTSADGIDGVLAAIGADSLELLGTAHCAYPAAVRDRIESLLVAGSDELARAAELDVELGHLFADAALAVCDQAGFSITEVRAIGSHGQTLRHQPQGPLPYSIQAGDPSVIAERTGVSVVADFRARDIAAGGQGAPLVPAFHEWLLRKPGADRAVVNIGGIANVTYLPGDPIKPVTGFDTGPGNTLLDRWIERHHKVPFDRDGTWATSGQPIESLLRALLTDPYFRQAPPKSTGREQFNIAWLERYLKRETTPRGPADVQATLAALTARTIAHAIRGLGDRPAVYVCGGGARNRDLMDRLRQERAGQPVETTAAIGIEPEWVEAAAFAWLACRTMAGQSGNIPSVTGARQAVILGGIYPGRWYPDQHGS